MMHARPIGPYRSPYPYGAYAQSFGVTRRPGIFVGFGPEYDACVERVKIRCMPGELGAACRQMATAGCLAQVQIRRMAAAAKTARDVAATAATTAATKLTAAQGAAQTAQDRVTELEAELTTCLDDLAALEVVAGALPPANDEKPKEGMSTTTKILIGVGGVAAIGGIYYMTRGR